MVVSVAGESQPLILVGMPRSGSTMLTRIINESPKNYLINDLYALQLIDEKNSWQEFSNRAEQLVFLEHLKKSVKIRSGLGSSGWIGQSSYLTRPQLEAILERIAPPNVEFGNWAFTIDFVMQQILAETGKTSWGWNTPQDHHHIDKIMASFPRAIILFLIRNPSAVLLSYKNHWRNTSQDKYSAIAQAFAWRKVIRNYIKAKKKYSNTIYLISYEEMIKEPRQGIEKLNRLLQTEISVDLNIESIGTNSSFQDLSTIKAKTLTPFELWISDMILFQERKYVGYDVDKADFSTDGMLDFLSRTAKFAKSYSSAILQSRDVRRRVYRLLRH